MGMDPVEKYRIRLKQTGFVQIRNPEFGQDVQSLRMNLTVILKTDKQNKTSHWNIILYRITAGCIHIQPTY